MSPLISFRHPPGAPAGPVAATSPKILVSELAERGLLDVAKANSFRLFPSRFGIGPRSDATGRGYFTQSLSGIASRSGHVIIPV